MKDETKKQLMLSVGMLAVLLLTLVFWYENFMFHTYIKQVDFQEYFYGMNADIMIDGYELCQDSSSAYYGNARIMATNEKVFLKNDKVNCVVTLTDTQSNEYVYEHSYKIKSENEVFYLNKEMTDKMDHNTSIEKANMKITITRNKKKVYDEVVVLQIGQFTTYNGGNKDYKIQDVYVSDKWLKTGYFSSTIENISHMYEHCIIDYTYLKEDGQIDNYDDYISIAQISASMDSIIKNEIQEVYYYDDQGSLFDKDIICFVTLKEKASDETGVTFMIELKGITKAGVTHG